MKNFKKLSRNQLKEVVGGGKKCSIVVKNSNGTFTTYTGTCTSTESPNTPALAPVIAWAISPNQYCETGLGNVTLSSNGGVSHCND